MKAKKQIAQSILNSVCRNLLYLTLTCFALCISARAQTWVAGGASIPTNAVLGGTENGQRLYVCRVRHEGGLHPGKLFNRNCHIGWGGSEIPLPQYEVLTGAGAWAVPRPQMAGALVGGGEVDRALYVCRARVNGAWHPGKAFGGNCLLGWGGRESSYSDYQALYFTASESLSVRLLTGVDDLRGGNSAYLTLRLVDGITLPEQLLSSGEGGNTASSKTIRYARAISPSQISSIRIRHDGNPRSGQPFDTYDNWDLKQLEIRIGGSLVYHSLHDARVRGGLLTRFTGELRQLELPLRAGSNEPDFIITAIRQIADRISVTFANAGFASGRVTNVACSSFGREISSSLAVTLNPGASDVVTVSMVPTRGRDVRCTVFGTDASGRAESVTGNNSYSYFF